VRQSRGAVGTDRFVRDDRESAPGQRQRRAVRPAKGGEITV
jgi:hypothetical protein